MSAPTAPGAGPRVAYVCADPGIAPDAVKGAAVHVREMVRALREAGAHVDVFVARPPHEACGDGGSFPVKVVAPPWREPGLAGEVRALASMGALLDALDGRGPYDAVYERCSLFGLGGLAYARQRGIPLLLEVNAPLWEEALRFRSLHLEGAARGAAHDLLRAADRVLVVSQELGRIVRAEGAEPSRVAHFPNGVRWDAFANARPAPRPAALVGKPVLTFVGSLKAWHGVPFLLQAFLRVAERRSVGLWIVGDGPLREVVDAAARAHPDAIVAQGAVPHEQVPGVLAASDIAVAPYTAGGPAYFCPLKVVEALAAGCPLLASDTPPVREVVGDPPVATLFRPDDLDAFGQAVDALLAAPALRAELGQRGRALVRARLTWAQRAAEVLDWVCAFQRRPAPTPASRPHRESSP